MNWSDLMAGRRFEKGSEEWQMFNEFWKICQNFCEPESSDEYWEQVIGAVNEFCNKHKADNDIFARKIVLAFIDTLEEKYKVNRNQGIRDET